MIKRLHDIKIVTKVPVMVNRLCHIKMMSDSHGSNIVSEGNKTGSEFCIVHTLPFDLASDDSSGNTPKEKLIFLIEERDKCLQKFQDISKEGNFKHPYHVYHHPPVYTCEEVVNLCPKIDPGSICGEMKNLFLVDKKKKNFYLVSALSDTEINLKAIAKLVGTKELRFASEDQLKEKLNLLPGSVTPFGLLNDRECLVKYFLENKAYESCDYLGFHPNSCISTVAIHKEDFISILEDPSMGNHTVTRIDM